MSAPSPVPAPPTLDGLDDMSSVLLSRETVATALHLVTTLAAQTVPGTAGAGVSLMSPGERSVAATDPLVERADALQYELAEGPCLLAYRDGELVVVDDVRTDRRFPRWSAAVRPIGFRSCVSVPLTGDAEVMGAIKVYSREPSVYDVAARALLGKFALQAAILLRNVQSLAAAERRSQLLRESLRNRDLIGQAKGLLIASGAADADTAFAVLARVSGHRQKRLAEVALELVEMAVHRNAAGPTSGPGPS